MIRCLISDILIYHHWKKHDADVIWQALIKEEKLYIGKLRHVNRKIENSLKKTNGNKELTYKRIHENSGIPMEVLDHANKLIVL
jgi:hypothetical protein